jgi:hypothetical protein
LAGPSASDQDDVRIRLVSRDTEQAHLCIGLPALPYSTERRYVQGTIEAILSSGMSSRLFQEIREKRGLVYSVYGYFRPYEDVGQGVVYAGTDLERVEEAISAIIGELRKLGCGVRLIPDGDVAGVIAVADPDTGIDVYIGTGGAPEGVLAASALRCVGGQMQGRLVFRNDDEVARARRWGIEDLERVYTLEDMAKGDCIFAATGVTDGSLLQGVHNRGGCVTTESIVMRASTGTVRRVSTEYHDLKHRGL